jgi:hypothetical protein
MKSSVRVKTCIGLVFGLLLTLFQRPVRAQLADHGNVNGNTYTDARFGLRYTFPKSLDIQNSVNGMPVGTGQRVGTSEFLFSAMEKPSGHVRSGVFITSDPIGAGGMRETDQFLRFAIANGMGVKHPDDFPKVAIANRSFYQGRVNIPGTVTIYGAQLATNCNNHFVVFWFSAASPRELESLLQSLNEMEMTCSPSAQGDR